jgi:hypothetical protein
MSRTNQKKILIFIFCILFIVFCFLCYRFYFSYQFTKAYDTYAALSTRHVTAAFLPATNDNAVRQELNRMLSDVLVADVSRHDRVARAERGLVLLNELEKQIDAIGDTGEAVSQAIAAMEDHASGDERKEIVHLALERLRIIGDIRGLSYRANYHTAEIFNRIIADGGSLTKEHVADLNNQIPLVEEQFDRRAGLYSELESVNNSIDRAISNLRVL